MRPFEDILLNLILLIFPLLIYLLYTVYSKTINIKENNLYLDTAIFSSFYLLVRIGNLNLNEMPFLIIDILLLTLFIKNRTLSISILSLLLCFYYYGLFNINIIYFILEYLFYFIIYLTIKDKDKLVNIFIIMKTIMFSISVIIKFNLNNKFDLFIIVILLFIVLSKLIIKVFKSFEETISLYRQIKDIEKEKNIIDSLFKITHEIKNPIAVCKGYLDMFDTNNLEHSKKYIPIIKSEIDRVLSLLKDFLSITKIKIEKEEMDLNVLLEDTVSCLKPIINYKNIKLINNFIDDEIYIVADYNRLKQTLINIIKNSVESIEEDGVIIIDTKVTDKKIKIIVSDSGKGMNKDELKQIKEAFFTTKANGTGLGTYLSNEIIKLHNGKLEYFSEKGNGTKVIITLPL